MIRIVDAQYTCGGRSDGGVEQSICWRLSGGTDLTPLFVVFESTGIPLELKKSTTRVLSPSFSPKILPQLTISES